MTPELINQVLYVVVPAIIAFLAGKWQGGKSPQGAAPVLQPTNFSPVGQGGILQGLSVFENALHAAPNSQPAPIGQGGILQFAGMTLQAIMNSQGATPAQKAAAASAITEAASTILSHKVGA